MIENIHRTIVIGQLIWRQQGNSALNEKMNLNKNLTFKPERRMQSQIITTIITSQPQIHQKERKKEKKGATTNKEDNQSKIYSSDWSVNKKKREQITQWQMTESRSWRFYLFILFIFFISPQSDPHCCTTSPFFTQPSIHRISWKRNARLCSENVKFSLSCMFVA